MTPALGRGAHRRLRRGARAARARLHGRRGRGRRDPRRERRRARPRPCAALSGLIDAHGTDRASTASDVVGWRPERIAAAGIAHVPQGRGTITDLTVDENLRLGAYTRRDREVVADIERWYDVFPRLAQRRDQLAGSMSGGEQQMLAIARALMARPKLVLLDEPSLGLAPIVTQELFQTLGALNREQGISMLVVEQNAGLALGIAQRGYVLETGSIVVAGSAAELAGNDDVRKAYLGI